MENTKTAQAPVTKIAIAAVLTAVVALFTFVIKIPIAPTRGYLNLGDVAIYFAALAFGPLTALIAGGLGTAIADIVAGYAQWAPISLVVHGLQGLVIGLIANRTIKRAAAGAAAQEVDSSGTAASSMVRSVLNIRLLLAILCGTAVMVAGYLLSGTLMVGFGAALTEVPGNLIQNAAGVLGGIPLSIAVRAAYPPVSNLYW